MSCYPCVLALLQKLDERVPVKILVRLWTGRAQFVVRLLTLSTFMDDSFRVATHFKDHASQAR